MFNYVQLNDLNIVIGVSQLSGEINQSNMVRIDNYDVSLLGKKYENGKFIEVPQEPFE